MFLPLQLELRHGWITLVTEDYLLFGQDRHHGRVDCVPTEFLFWPLGGSKGHRGPRANLGLGNVGKSYGEA